MTRRRGSETTLEALGVIAKALLATGLVMIFVWAFIPGSDAVPLSIGLGGLAIALLAVAARSWLKQADE